jgi:hypothetical protein
MGKKNVREYCRNKYGKDWWNVPPAIKKKRKAEANKALGAAGNAPFKRVHRISLQPYGDDGVVHYAAMVKPESCLDGGDGPKYAPLEKKHKKVDIGFWAVHFDFTDPNFSDEIWVGSDLNPTYGDCARYWDASADDTPDTVALRLIESGGIGTYTEPDGFDKGSTHEVDNSKLVVSQLLWEQISAPVRERFLREVFAEDVYITLTPSWE